MSISDVQLLTSPEEDETLVRLMQTVRKKQAKRAKPLAGMIKLSPDQKVAAQQSAALIQVFNATAGYEALNTLMIRFLDMARRNEVAIPEKKMPLIAAMLLREWAMNVEALALKKKFDQLLPLTLYQGADFATAPTEPRFKEFHDTLGIFRQVAIYYPMRPRAHLKFMKDTIRALKADDEFAEFRDTPGIFRTAVNTRPGNPAEFLRMVQAHIARLSLDPRFKEYETTPSIIKLAAIHNVNDPEAFLLKVQKNIKTLSKDPALKFFKDSPGIIKHAAVSHPGEARKFLLEIIQTSKALAQEKEFAKLAQDHEGIIVFAACYYRTDPRKFLRSYKETFDDLFADPEYESLRQHRWAFKYAAKNMPSDPRGFMDKILSGEIDTHGWNRQGDGPQP